CATGTLVTNSARAKANLVITTSYSKWREATSTGRAVSMRTRRPRDGSVITCRTAVSFSPDVARTSESGHWRVQLRANNLGSTNPANRQLPPMLNTSDSTDHTMLATGRVVALDRARTFVTLLVVLYHAVINYTHFGIGGDRMRWLGFDLVVLFC